MTGEYVIYHYWIFGGIQALTKTNVGNLSMGNFAIIKNCEIGVQLNSTGGSSFGSSGQESSTISGAVFEDNEIAVLLKGNRGLTVFNTRFSDNQFGNDILL